jgi:hypothetical protein
VNEFQHWSVATIVRPGLVIDEILTLNNKTSNREMCNLEEDNIDQLLKDDEIKKELQSCIIFMDSMKVHSKNKISKMLLLYLFNEFISKKYINNNDINIDRNFFTKLNMPVVQCNSPLQENSFDCGVYVIKYVEYILKICPKPTRNEIDNGEFQNTFSFNAFDQTEVTGRRTEMRAILDEIQIKWSIEKKERDIRNKDVIDNDDEVTEIIPFDSSNINNDIHNISYDDILGERIEVHLKEDDECDGGIFVSVNLKPTDTLHDFFKNLEIETKISLNLERGFNYYDNKIITVEKPKEFENLSFSSLLTEIAYQFKNVINKNGHIFTYYVLLNRIKDDLNKNNIVEIDIESNRDFIDTNSLTPKENINFMTNLNKPHAFLQNSLSAARNLLSNNISSNNSSNNISSNNSSNNNSNNI